MQTCRKLSVKSVVVASALDILTHGLARTRETDCEEVSECLQH